MSSTTEKIENEIVGTGQKTLTCPILEFDDDFDQTDPAMLLRFSRKFVQEPADKKVARPQESPVKNTVQPQGSAVKKVIQPQEPAVKKPQEPVAKKTIPEPAVKPIIMGTIDGMYLI